MASEEREVLPGMYFTPRTGFSTPSTAKPESLTEITRRTLEELISVAILAEKEKSVHRASVLESEVNRLRNSMHHLKRSNAEMAEFLSTDPSLQEHIRENETVLVQQQMRIHAVQFVIKGSSVNEAMAQIELMIGSTRALQTDDTSHPETTNSEDSLWL